MKTYSVEVFMGARDYTGPMDDTPCHGEYSEETVMHQVTSESYDLAKRAIKAEFPSARYIHLIDASDIRVG